jgi:cyclase
LVAALEEGRADAALAASIFHRREFSISQVKLAMERAGIPARLNGGNPQ